MKILNGDMRQTDRLRTVGTRNLVDAARLFGATKFVTQSIVFGYRFIDHGDHLINEDDPFGRPGGDVQSYAAMLQRKVAIPANGADPLSWIHIEDAASATAAAALDTPPASAGGT